MARVAALNGGYGNTVMRRALWVTIAVELLGWRPYVDGAWDPSRPWLIDHPPHYLEARVCGCGREGPWQRYSLGADLYDAGNASWSPPAAGSSHAACHEVVAKASTATYEFLRGARRDATLNAYSQNYTCVQGGCKCPGYSELSGGAEQAALRRSVLSRGDPMRLQHFYRKLSQCTGHHAGTNPITVRSKSPGHFRMVGAIINKGLSSLV
jgi:hypothetical protein